MQNDSEEAENFVGPGSACYLSPAHTSLQFIFYSFFFFVYEFLIKSLRFFYEHCHAPLSIYGLNE